MARAVDMKDIISMITFFIIILIMISKC